MKKKNRFILFSIGGLLSFLATGLLINHNLEKEYKRGEYVPSEDAYFVEKVTDPAGRIKAHKFLTPSDNQYSKQKSYSHSSSLLGNIENVWDAYTGKGTKVAIIDDGFDYTHPEYIRNDGSSAILNESGYFYSKNPNVYESEVYFKAYADNPNNIAEDWEEVTQEEAEAGYVDAWATHGTNTSTTAAAPINGVGGVGIAPEADILALKIDFSFSAIRSAINYAVAQGVDVINMSLGAYAEDFDDGFGDEQYGGSKTATFLNDACQAAYDAGIIVVAAAGNEATWHKSYPACSSKVIGVGALYKNAANTLAPFTNYVSTSQSGEINVDILAPGYVWTAHQEGTKSSPTHTYNETQGTSFSSPIVAGAACLWKQKHKSGTPSQFLSQLQSTASDIGNYKNKNIPINYYEDYDSPIGPSNITCGRLNVANLLEITEPFVEPVQSNINLAIGESSQIRLDTYNGTISYSSGNTAIATVSDTGLVKGISEGNTTITVTATKNNKTAKAYINVTISPIVSVTSMSFDPNAISLEVGQSYSSEETITVTPNDATRAFLFESDNESVATVDMETGEITAIGKGTAHITAIAGYSDNDASDTLTVTVTEPTTTYWTKVTSTSDVTNGDYLIVYENGNKAFDGSRSTLDAAFNTIDVEISNNKILYDTTTAASKFTIADVTNGYSIKSASGYYIGKNSGSSNGMDSSTSTVYLNSITISSSKATITGSGGKQLLFNTANDQQRFRYMGATDSNISLFKANGSTPTPTPEPTKTLSSISLDTTNVQKDFEVNDTFNYTGLVVTAHYSDSSSSTVTPTNVSTPDMTTTGNKTVTVTYTEGSVSKTATYQISVTSSGGTPGDTDFEATYNMENIDTAWTLTDYSTESNYLKCPAAGNNSVALISHLFNGKDVTSDIVISLHIATYGSGDNPVNSTFRFYTESGCQNEISATRSGSLPSSSSTYTDAIYTISAANAASFEDDLAIKITKPGKQIRLQSFSVSFSYEQGTPKVINSLVASYSGNDIYVGGNLDTSKVSVTAKYTEPSKYVDTSLASSDYQLSGFNSDTAGNKTVTVTYTGIIDTVTSPLTTTFNVNVINDNVKTVTVTNTKTYHPGENIVKGDITVTLTFDSGKQETTTDFSFADDGYMFTYSDAPSGGSNGNKQFSITYGNQNYNFTVVVNRIAHENIITGGDTLNRVSTGIASGSTSYTSWEDVEGATGSIYAGNSAGGNDSIQLRSKNSDSGIVMTSSSGNVKKVTVTWNSNTQSGRTLEIYGKNTAYSSASDLYGNNKGTLLGTIVYGTSTEFEITGDYAYIGVRSSDGALYLTDITFAYNGSENANNFANFMMHEDTNNQCVSKLDDAIALFEAMSEEERTTFMTSNNYVIKQARTRLEAWLVNQNKSISYVDGDYVIGNNKHSISVITNNGGETIMIVVLSSLLVMSFVGSLYLFSKRKH